MTALPLLAVIAAQTFAQAAPVSSAASSAAPAPAAAPSAAPTPSTPSGDDAPAKAPGQAPGQAPAQPQAPAPAANPGAANGAPAPMDPTKPAANDPLTLVPEVAERIGSDDLTAHEDPTGKMDRTFYGLYYREQLRDYRLTLTPLTLDHERGLGPGNVPTPSYDHESLYGFLYYRRRSARTSADVLFPLAWHIRNDDSSLWAFLPVLHRESSNEHDNWVAPLMFEGRRPDSGYFHLPALLTFSWYDPKSAFTLSTLYFRTRSYESVDEGFVPFFFTGDNHNEEGARKSYTLIPPALYYTKYTELDQDRLTVLGPFIWGSNPKRSVFDFAPLFFQITGKPESGGKRESHTTLFPLFHYGKSDEQEMAITPLFFRRQTATVDTFITPFYSYASTRKGADRGNILGPIVPLAWWSRDHDTGAHSLGIAPFFHSSASSEGSALITPLFGHFENYGVSKTTWAFPTFVYGSDTSGWGMAFHPLLYFGRTEADTSHAVVAPLYWDFKGKGGRTTLGIPLFWRFADYETDRVTEVVVNSVYVQKKVQGGLDWEYHFAPLVSWGKGPDSNFWNFLFGFAGYSRRGEEQEIRALWIPITIHSAAEPKGPPAKATGLAR